MTSSVPRLSTLALGLALATPAGATDRFPTRGGESGLLDVPDAETVPRGSGRLGGELGLQRPRGGGGDVSPLPASLVTGFAERIEVGLAMRQGGMPGDPEPSPTLFTAAMKLRLLESAGWRPGVAMDAYLDRFNSGGVLGSRLAASTPPSGRIRLAGYLGAEGHGPRPVALGPTAGVAAAIVLGRDLETVLEALTGPRGPVLGGALRWGLLPSFGMSLGATWLPSDGGLRFSLGFAVSSVPLETRPVPLAPEAAKPAAPADRVVEQPAFAEARPRFRLRMNTVTSPADGTHRHLQYTPAPEAAPQAPAPHGETRP